MKESLWHEFKQIEFEFEGHHPHGLFDNPEKPADLIMERI